MRGITNLSSGKMGYAIAEAAASLGAEVTLISGPTALAPPAQAHFVYVTSAAEMATAVKAHVAGADFFFGVAAVADYTPVAASSRKLKKSAEPMELKLEPTEDILAYVAALPQRRRSASASPPRARTSPTTRRPSARARRSR